MPRLIEWERLELTLRGEKIAAMIGEAIDAKKAPITSLFLEFRDGELAIEGKAKKGLTIPFEAKVRSIRPDGGWLRVKIEEASAFGLPVPAFLQKFIEGGVKDGSVRYDPETSELMIDLARRIPEFVDVAIDSVAITKAGVVIRLGAGGSDIPPRGKRE
ncbi:MAG: hypothetical protein NDJ92_18470 [Thermoanaerobaculia bacterium]|nr:hypothetical protein [Thermoanaerobaculia bacterium]